MGLGSPPNRRKENSNGLEMRSAMSINKISLGTETQKQGVVEYGKEGGDIFHCSCPPLSILLWYLASEVRRRENPIPLALHDFISLPILRVGGLTKLAKIVKKKREEEKACGQKRENGEIDGLNPRSRPKQGNA